MDAVDDGLDEGASVRRGELSWLGAEGDAFLGRRNGYDPQGDLDAVDEGVWAAREDRANRRDEPW